VDRPKVVTINSTSVDGRIAASPDALLLHGDKRWEAIEEWGATDAANGAFERLKSIHTPEATLEGSGSFVKEGDELEQLPPFMGDLDAVYQDFLPQAVVQRPGHRGWFTVVDGRGRGRRWIKDGGVFGEAWEGWHLLVLVAHQTPREYLAYLQHENIPYLVAGEGRVDLRLGLEKMKSQLDITCVLSTAGGKLNGALLRAGLVDEINVEFLPAVIGGFDTPSLFDSPVLGPDQWPTRLRMISCQVHAGGRVWLRYRVSSQEVGEEGGNG
jgi:2,5-diamino-6-(ribosylamino)-4(3H)-pyrimidinone 5'-phosphate reductase